MADLNLKCSHTPRIHFCFLSAAQNKQSKGQSKHLGPVVQSIVSLTSSLGVKILTVLKSTISSSQVFLLKENVSKLLTFFSKNISKYAIFNGQSFNDSLTNDIVNFEQLGPKLSALLRLQNGN